MFGSHLSIAGSMVNALKEAETLGLDTVQVFTKNQQQWKAKPLDPGMVKEWHGELTRLKWEGRTVSHASYLINLASPNEELWNKSIDLMHDEIERCEVLGIPFLVHHPGSYMESSLELGLGRIASAYHKLLSDTKGYKTVLCLEGTTGSGRHIGGKFEHLAELKNMIGQATGEDARVGFCLDTCHIHSAGYDISTRAGAKAALEEFDRVCGMKHLKVFHMNDSKGKAGSKLDRHEHMGRGTIGVSAEHFPQSGFWTVVNHPHIAKVPKILETPKENTPEGEAWDLVNVRALRGLVGKP